MANPAFYRKFKAKKSETVGILIYNLGNKQWNISALRELLENILPEKGKLNNYVVTHDFPQIGRRTMIVNARRVDSKQLIMITLEDVSSQAKLDLDSAAMTLNLISQRDQLLNLSDSKDEFVSLASHQLRTPATAVKQYIGMLIQGFVGDLTDQQKKMLDVAYQSNERQLAIIEDLLRVAKVDAGKLYLDKTPNDIVKLVKAVIQEQEVLFLNRQQKILFKQPSKKVFAPVNVDAKLMSMVINNLLDNAGKYSPAGGKVTVSVDQTDEHTFVSIQDSGVGILNTMNSKLFKRFSRIDNAFSVAAGGTGLGLYWAKKVMDLHRGAISVTSMLNIGSTFTVKIPNSVT